jgi:predicted DNA binding CopG/RHH family protein
LKAITLLSIDNVENEKKRYLQITRSQMSKKKAISIRLLESDIVSVSKPNLLAAKGCLIKPLLAH